MSVVSRIGFLVLLTFLIVAVSTRQGGADNCDKECRHVTDIYYYTTGNAARYYDDDCQWCVSTGCDKAGKLLAKPCEEDPNKDLYWDLWDDGVPYCDNNGDAVEGIVATSWATLIEKNGKVGRKVRKCTTTKKE
jgi:hypothetical protein